MVKQPVGTFVRDGRTMDAYTPGEAVALRAAGWLELDATPVSNGGRPARVSTPESHRTRVARKPEPGAAAETAAAHLQAAAVQSQDAQQALNDATPEDAS